MKNDYDIIIIGGGLVGTSLVCALQHQGLRIAVLEKHVPNLTISSAKTDGRPISLAHSSQLILNTLGIWSQLQELATPIKMVHISSQHHFGITRIKAEDHQLPALGYVLPFSALRQTLYQCAKALPSVDIICSAELIAININQQSVKVTFAKAGQEQHITASLLIAADGTHSQCRQILNIPTKTRDEGAMALTAAIELQHAHEYIAYQRITQHGTLALLPMWNRKQYRLVWSANKMQKVKQATWSNQQLCNFVSKVFADRVGPLHAITCNGRFPLVSKIAEQQIQPSVVILGNAAHTIYPLAAQGFNLGLRDAATLADVLVAAKEQGKPLNDWQQLQDYQQWRAADQKKTIGLTQTLSVLFDLQLPLFKQTRAIGLLALDLLPGLKSRLSQQAMGCSGKLSRLARGIPLWE